MGYTQLLNIIDRLLFIGAEIAIIRYAEKFFSEHHRHLKRCRMRFRMCRSPVKPCQVKYFKLLLKAIKVQRALYGICFYQIREVHQVHLNLGEYMSQQRYSTLLNKHREIAVQSTSHQKLLQSLNQKYGQCARDYLLSQVWLEYITTTTCIYIQVSQDFRQGELALLLCLEKC